MPLGAPVIRACGTETAGGSSSRRRRPTWPRQRLRVERVKLAENQRRVPLPTAGALWTPPYAVDVTKLLLPGDNRLRVVANTAMNYMAGRKLPDYRLLHLRYGERFQPQDMDQVKPLPSGLFGPVRLTATERVR
jgi:hypothetical protein